MLNHMSKFTQQKLSPKFMPTTFPILLLCKLFFSTQLKTTGNPAALLNSAASSPCCSCCLLMILEATDDQANSVT